MKSFPARYRKTIGSLLMVAAFVVQWVLTEYVEPAAEATFSNPDTCGDTSLQTQNLELLFHVTGEPTHLHDAIRTRALFYYEFLTSPAFDEATVDHRLGPVAEAMTATPDTFEEYARLKVSLGKHAGRLWGDEWRPGAQAIKRRGLYLRVAIFLVSLLGLLLIWSGENFEGQGKQ